ncbi:unnamed protein product [Amoebophrya sp. A120]|nr:unnamed protein product [Amoebophrya sp. A120]|eukprot:GSA120T00021835001.1
MQTQKPHYKSYGKGSTSASVPLTAPPGINKGISKGSSSSSTSAAAPGYNHLPPWGDQVSGGVPPPPPILPPSTLFGGASNSAVSTSAKTPATINQGKNKEPQALPGGLGALLFQPNSATSPPIWADESSSWGTTNINAGNPASASTYAAMHHPQPISGAATAQTEDYNPFLGNAAMGGSKNSAATTPPPYSGGFVGATGLSHQQPLSGTGTPGIDQMMGSSGLSYHDSNSKKSTSPFQQEDLHPPQHQLGGINYGAMQHDYQVQDTAYNQQISSALGHQNLQYQPYDAQNRQNSTTTPIVPPALPAPLGSSMVPQPLEQQSTTPKMTGSHRYIQDIIDKQRGQRGQNTSKQSTASSYGGTSSTAVQNSSWQTGNYPHMNSSSTTSHGQNYNKQTPHSTRAATTTWGDRHGGGHELYGDSRLAGIYSGGTSTGALGELQNNQKDLHGYTSSHQQDKDHSRGTAQILAGGFGTAGTSTGFGRSSVTASTSQPSQQRYGILGAGGGAPTTTTSAMAPAQNVDQYQVQQPHRTAASASSHQTSRRGDELTHFKALPHIPEPMRTSGAYASKKAEFDAVIAMGRDHWENTNLSTGYVEYWDVNMAKDELVQNWHDECIAQCDHHGFTCVVERQDYCGQPNRFVAFALNKNGTRRYKVGVLEHLANRDLPAEHQTHHGGTEKMRYVNSNSQTMDPAFGILVCVNYRSILAPRSMIGGLSGQEKKTGQSRQIKGKFGDGLKAAAHVFQRLKEQRSGTELSMLSSGYRFVFANKPPKVCKTFFTLQYTIEEVLLNVKQHFEPNVFHSTFAHSHPGITKDQQERNKTQMRQTTAPFLRKYLEDDLQVDLAKDTVITAYHVDFKPDRYLFLLENRYRRLRPQLIRGEENSYEILTDPEYQGRFYVKGMLVTPDSNKRYAWSTAARAERQQGGGDGRNTFRRDMGKGEAFFGYNLLNFNMVCRDRWDSLKYDQYLQEVIFAWHEILNKIEKFGRSTVDVERDVTAQRKGLWMCIKLNPDCMEAEAMKRNVQKEGEILRTELDKFFRAEYPQSQPCAWHDCERAHLIQRIGFKVEYVPAVMMELLAQRLKDLNHEWEKTKAEQLSKCNADYSDHGIFLTDLLSAAVQTFFRKKCEKEVKLFNQTQTLAPCVVRVVHGGHRFEREACCVMAQEVTVFNLQGFMFQENKHMNGRYHLDTEQQVGGRPTFWHERKTHFIYQDDKDVYINTKELYKKIHNYRNTNWKAKLSRSYYMGYYSGGGVSLADGGTIPWWQWQESRWEEQSFRTKDVRQVIIKPQRPPELRAHVTQASHVIVNSGHFSLRADYKNGHKNYIGANAVEDKFFQYSMFTQQLAKTVCTDLKRHRWSVDEEAETFLTQQLLQAVMSHFKIGAKGILPETSGTRNINAPGAPQTHASLQGGPSNTTTTTGDEGSTGLVSPNNSDGTSPLLDEEGDENIDDVLGQVNNRATTTGAAATSSPDGAPKETSGRPSPVAENTQQESDHIAATYATAPKIMAQKNAWKMLESDRENDSETEVEHLADKNIAQTGAGATATSADQTKQRHLHRPSSVVTGTTDDEAIATDLARREAEEAQRLEDQGDEELDDTLWEGVKSKKSFRSSGWYGEQSSTASQWDNASSSEVNRNQWGKKPLGAAGTGGGTSHGWSASSSAGYSRGLHGAASKRNSKTNSATGSRFSQLRSANDYWEDDDEEEEEDEQYDSTANHTGTKHKNYNAEQAYKGPASGQSGHSTSSSTSQWQNSNGAPASSGATGKQTGAPSSSSTAHKLKSSADAAATAPAAAPNSSSSTRNNSSASAVSSSTGSVIRAPNQNQTSMGSSFTAASQREATEDSQQQATSAPFPEELETSNRAARANFKQSIDFTTTFFCTKLAQAGAITPTGSSRKSGASPGDIGKSLASQLSKRSIKRIESATLFAAERQVRLEVNALVYGHVDRGLAYLGDAVLDTGLALCAEKHKTPPRETDEVRRTLFCMDNLGSGDKLKCEQKEEEIGKCFTVRDRDAYKKANLVFNNRVAQLDTNWVDDLLHVFESIFGHVRIPNPYNKFTRNGAVVEEEKIFPLIKYALTRQPENEKEKKAGASTSGAGGAASKANTSSSLYSLNKKSSASGKKFNAKSLTSASSAAAREGDNSPGGASSRNGHDGAASEDELDEDEDFVFGSDLRKMFAQSLDAQKVVQKSAAAGGSGEDANNTVNMKNQNATDSTTTRPVPRSQPKAPTVIATSSSSSSTSTGNQQESKQVVPLMNAHPLAIGGSIVRDIEDLDVNKTAGAPAGAAAISRSSYNASNHESAPSSSYTSNYATNQEDQTSFAPSSPGASSPINYTGDIAMLTKKQRHALNKRKKREQEELDLQAIEDARAEKQKIEKKIVDQTASLVYKVVDQKYKLSQNEKETNRDHFAFALRNDPTTRYDPKKTLEEDGGRLSFRNWFLERFLPKAFPQDFKMNTNKVRIVTKRPEENTRGNYLDVDPDSCLWQFLLKEGREKLLEAGGLGGGDRSLTFAQGEAIWGRLYRGVKQDFDLIS